MAEKRIRGNINIVAGRTRGWTASATGVAIILLLMSDAFGNDSQIARILVSVAIPTLFFVNGYTMRLAGSGRAFLRHLKADAICLVLPLVFFWLVRSSLLYLMGGTRHTAYDLNLAARAAWNSLYYMYGSQFGDVASIGIIWILFVLFACRLIIRTVHLLFAVISRRGSEGDYYQAQSASKYHVAESIVLCIVGIIGCLILPRAQIVLPFNLGAAIAMVLFSWLGGEYRRYVRKMDRIKVYFPVCGVAVLVYVIARVNQAYFNLNEYMYMRSVLALVGGIAGTALIVVVARQVCRVNVVRDLLAVPGRNFIVLVFVRYMDTFTSILWNYSGENPAAVPYVRLLNDLAITLVIVNSYQKLNPLGRKKDLELSLRWKRQIDLLFYFAFVWLLINGTVWDFYSVPTFLRPVYDAYSIAVILMVLIFGVSIARVESKAQLVFMLAVLGLCYYYMYQGGEGIVFYSCVVALAVLGKPYRKIIGITLIESFCAILLAYYLSMNGYINYLVQGNGSGLTGHAFGFAHRNNTGLSLLAMGMLYCSFRDPDRRCWLPFDIAVLGLGIFVNYRYIGSRSSLLCNILLLIMWIMYILLHLIRKQKPSTLYSGLNSYVGGYDWKSFSKGDRAYCIFGIILFPLMEIANIIMTLSYDPFTEHFLFERFFPSSVDLSTFRTRLQLGYTALMVTRIKPLGNNFTDSAAIDYYFYLDSSYIRILVKYGLVVTLIFFALMALCVYRFVKNKKYFLIWILVVIAIYGISERYFFYYAYNPALLIAFSDMAEKHPISFDSRSTVSDQYWDSDDEIHVYSLH